MVSSAERHFGIDCNVKRTYRIVFVERTVYYTSSGYDYRLKVVFFPLFVPVLTFNIFSGYYYSFYTSRHIGERICRSYSRIVVGDFFLNIGKHDGIIIRARRK